MTFAVAAAAFIIDRLTKFAATGALSSGDSVAVIPNVFHLTLVANSGVAFGLFRNWRLFPIFTSFAAALAIVYYAVKARHIPAPVRVCLGLILGGALGNLADRLRFGYVIDFLDFRIWPVFNFADSCITTGVILLAVNMITQNSKSKAQN